MYNRKKYIIPYQIDGQNKRTVTIWDRTLAHAISMAHLVIDNQKLCPDVTGHIIYVDEALVAA